MERDAAGLKSTEGEEARISVNITLNIIPFGRLEIRDSFSLNP